MIAAISRRLRREGERNMARAASPAEAQQRIAFDRFALRMAEGTRDWQAWAYFASDLGRLRAEQCRRAARGRA